jgi:hypothetical protein
MATIALKDGEVIFKDGKASCTCCGCPECQTTPTPELIEVLNVATTGTCFGNPPMFWNITSSGWYAGWFAQGNIYTLQWDSSTKCLSLGGDNAMNIITSGGAECCGNNECVVQSYTINGISFPCVSIIFDPFFGPVTPPVFVF